MYLKKRYIMIYMDMNKYHNGKIYKIVDVGYNKQYIGSTTEKLSRRFAHHKGCYKAYQRSEYRHTRSFDLFEEYGVENCKIELLENFKCETKEELLRREGEFIRDTDCVNKIIAGRTKKEYSEEYREWMLNLKKMYRQTHKQQKQEENRQYRENNSEKIAEYKKQKINCECGILCSKGHIAAHRKSKRHQQHLNSLEQIDTT